MLIKILLISSLHEVIIGSMEGWSLSVFFLIKTLSQKVYLVLRLS